METNNALIAKFMGWQSKMFQVYADQEKEQIWFRPGEDFPSDYYRSVELLFDSSWDWLMPVIEKIEKLGYDTGICGVLIGKENLTEVLITPCVKKNGSVEVHSRTSQPKFENVYRSVVEFIILTQ